MPRQFGGVRQVMRYVGMAGSGLLIISAIGLLIAVVPVFGNKALIVRSGSMQPAIGVGDLVVVREASEYRAGDVMAFESATSKDTVVTHRVAEVVNEGEGVSYITKGDANDAADEAVVTADRVLGKQIFLVPYIGKGLAFGKTRLGFMAFIVVPAMLVMLGDVRVIWREIRKGRRKEKVVPTPALAVAGARAAALPKAECSEVFVKKELEEVELSPAMTRSVRRVPRLYLDSVMAKVLILVVSVGMTIPSGLAFYADSEISTGNIFQAAACGELPGLPTHLYPPDGLVAGADSDWVADPFLDWTDSFAACSGTTQYQYQSALNPDFAPAIFTSGLLNDSMIPAPGTPDGTYFWHVRATADGGSTFTEWTDFWVLTVDRTVP